MRRRRSRPAKGRRRGRSAEIARHELCRGPGNLTMALGITLEENALDLEGDRLFVEDRGINVSDIAWSGRIGISVGTEHIWRVYAAGHPAVSGTRGVRHLTGSAEESTTRIL
jgi:DNA-3-methyladenine glycosylase